MVGGNIIISLLVLLSSWLLFAGHDQPAGLLGRAQRSDAAAAAPPSVVHVGALLDLGSAGGRASRASISLALEDFYASQPPGSGGATAALHVADCKDDEITAASAGSTHFFCRSPTCIFSSILRAIAAEAGNCVRE